MNRLLLSSIVFFVSITGVLAQNKDSIKYDDLYSPKVNTISEGKGELQRFHGKLIFTETNTYLSARDVTNDFWKKYNSAQRLQYWGRYIWTLGLSYAASDVVFHMLYKGGDGLLADPSFILGGVLTLVGGSMDYGGWAKLGNLAKTYNSDPGVRKTYSLNLGPTRSGGFGLSLNF